MKTIAKHSLLLLIGALLLKSTNSKAQAIEDIMNKTSDQRQQERGEQDSRNVKLGLFVHYFLSPSEKYQNNSAFDGGYGGGLRLYIPAYTKGDGTIGDDYTGDIVVSAIYTNWSGSLSPDLSTTYPSLNSYTGLVGFRFGLGGLLFFEPAAGYTYGVSSPNDEYQSKTYTTQAVSGPTYSLRAGITVVKFWDIYAVAQATTTTQFGTCVNFGAGMDLRF
jgi:hypothetical protein